MRALLAWTSWWLVMGGCFGFALWWAGGETPSPSLVLGMTVANTFLLVAAEQLLPRKPEANLLRDRQTLNDVAHGVVFQFAGRPLAQGLVVVALAGAAQHASVASVWPREWPLLAQVASAILLWSLLGYGYHRAQHAFDALWWFHAVHHDTRQMHLFKSGRAHVGEEFLEYLFIPAPFILLGIGPEVMTWVALWNVFQGNLAHSNLDQRFPASFHYWLPTVQNHYIHHAEPRHLQDSNFGSFPIWDRLFGSYRHPDANPVKRVGLAGDPVPADFLGQLAYPFRSLLAAPLPQSSRSDRWERRARATPR